MLRMVPKTFSWTLSVMDGAEPVAQAVNVSWWKDKAEINLQGATYIARREGVMSGAYLLESPTGVVARATKPSVWRRSLIVEHAGRTYTLGPASAWRREFVLFEGSTRIGSISPESMFTRRAVVDLPPSVPFIAQVFIIWLTATLWKHDEASGTAGAAAAG